MFYGIGDYGRMIADSVRMDAYAAALERVINPDTVVLDIGTGTGIAALLAARFGARRVFAVDPSPVIEVARQSARDNGYADRIEFFETSSLEVELPELADVVVADLRGILPHYSVHLSVLEDARRRLLKPSGVLIPQRDILSVALAEAPNDFRERLDVWRAHGRGFDLEATRTLVANEFGRTGVANPGALLSEPRVVATLDYATGETGDLAASIVFKARRRGTLHGLYAWFDTVLFDDIGFSNAPGTRADSIYGHAFFALPEEVAVSEGEEVRVELAASFIADDYVYRWNVQVGPAESPRARFRQSTFSSFPLSARVLRLADETHRPSVNDEGRRVQRALGLMDGQRTVADIADDLEKGGDSREEALRLATALSQEYGCNGR